YQTHGATFDPRSPPGSAYIVQRYSRSSRWDIAPNGLQNSFIGIKGTEPIGGNTSVVFALDAGFDPYSFKLSSGPGSAAQNAGVPQDQQPSWADSSRAGQWYNGNGYVGLSSPSYGTLTVFRQNALTYDGVLEYDPMGASYAFSPIGWQGLTCGGGNTENCRHTTSLKYRLTVGQARVAAIWQFGGYGQNNASNGAYQFGGGGEIPNLAHGVLSFDAIYSYVKDSVATAVLGGSTDANGNPIPPFLPDVLTADDLRQQSRDAAGQIHEWTPEVVCGLRTDSIFGAQRSTDGFYQYRGRLRLPGMSSIQQHEYQQYGVRCRRFC